MGWPQVVFWQKCWQKNPKDRYQQYEELILDIEALVSNKPLKYAKDSKVLALYTYNPEKKKTTTERLKSWLLSPSKEDQDSKPTSRVIDGTITSRIVSAMQGKENIQVEKTQKKEMKVPLATKQM